MTKTDYLQIALRRLAIVLAAIVAIHVALGIRPAFAAEPAEYDHIRTEMTGDAGPVIVLIPGMSTPAEVWDDTVARFGKDNRVLVVEVRGFDGERGTANEQPGVMDGILSDLAKDLEQRGIVADAMVGHSFGGLLAMKFALTRPDLTHQVMVVDALPFFGTVFDAAATVESSTPRAAQMRDMMIRQADIIRAARETSTGNAPANGMALDPVASKQITQWSMNAEPLVVAQALYEDFLTDMRGDIARISPPVTVLYMAHQQPEIATERYTTDYSALETARLVPVDRTGHFIMLDRPDAFQAELAKLLDRPE